MNLLDRHIFRSVLFTCAAAVGLFAFVVALPNVLRDLRRLGLVKSLKGRRGGYLLAKPAEEIDLLALQQGLAGSGDAAQAGEAATHGAELWPQQLESRWRQDLAATSLRDVQRSVAASDPLAEPQAREEASS